MKDEIIILIRKWFKSKTGTDLIHDPSLISLVNEIEALRKHDVVRRSEQLCDCYDSNEINEVEIKEICCRCRKPTT